MTVRYFRTPAAFRRWLEANHASARELQVGFHKKASGRPSLTWPESVDEALSFGWIDGVRKGVDAERYTIRFTPRRERSTWSAVNVERVRVLTEEGRMRPAGLEAFRRRREEPSGAYSYETRPDSLPEPYLRELRENRRAWAYFEAQAPGYRRTAAWWVISARREETRARRLAALVEASEAGRPVGPLARRTPRRA